jgi:hypothetical protein
LELLTAAFFQIIVTALVACLLLTALTCVGTALIGFRTRCKWYFSLAVLAFSMLGFVAGTIMADSREPTVAAVLPAVLTLMGGVAAFHIGSKGVENQVAVCALIFVFSLALYVGSFYGSEVRMQNEASVSRDIEREKSRHAVDVQRLVDYIELLKLKRDFESQEKVDLSRFESSVERQNENKKSEQAGK